MCASQVIASHAVIDDDGEQLGDCVALSESSPVTAAA